jgi:hypothetical protein
LRRPEGVSAMTPKNRPRARPERPIGRRLSPGDQQRVRAGIEASEHDEAIALTADEAQAYYETGVLPERVKKWVASRG